MIPLLTIGTPRHREQKTSPEIPQQVLGRAGNKAREFGFPSCQKSQARDFPSSEESALQLRGHRFDP